MRRFARPAAGLCLALAILAGGCQGHGAYTQEHINASQARLDQIKSANEFQMAEQAFLAGELEKALTKIEQSIQYNDQVARSHVLRGRILAEMNILTESMASFARAEAIEPDNVDAQYYQGVLHERVQEREPALARYTRALELAPSNPQFALAAAEVMIDMGNLDRAEAFLAERETTFRLDPGVQQLLGHIAMMRGDTQTAAARFGQARILAPEDQSTTEDLVQALMELGNYSEADFYLSAMLRRSENEDRRDLKHLRVQCLQTLGRPVEARDILVKLIEGEGQTDVQAWIALGNVALELRDLGRVRECAARVVGLAPDRADGYILRAMWNRRMGDYSAALRSLDSALNATPDDTSLRVMQAAILVEAGRTDLAIHELRLAQAGDPTNPQVNRALESLMREAAAPTN
ncbi:MAG: tetratricopeptide repeat protein [Phycisphaerales bacterium]